MTGGGWKIFHRFLFIYTCLISRILSQQGLSEYCLLDTFIAECGEDEVVVMETASYGRMKEGRCISGATSILSMGCSTDALPYLDKLCSGRSKCEFKTLRLIDLIPPSEQACPFDLVSYLEAEYTCKKVITHNTGCKDRPVASIHYESGYLSSYIAETSKTGLVKCPWRIEALPGQTITFSLMDFGVSDYKEKGLSNCVTYAVIRNPITKESKDICTRGEREVKLDVTGTGMVDVRFLERPEFDQQGHALLYYEVSGCADIDPPRWGWLKRNGSKISWGCHDNEIVVNITCVNNQWSDKPGNCTKPIGPPPVAPVLYAEEVVDDNNKNKMLPIMFLISMGLLISAVLVLIIGFVSIHWQKQSHKSRVELIKATLPYWYTMKEKELRGEGTMAPPVPASQDGVEIYGSEAVYYQNATNKRLHETLLKKHTITMATLKDITKLSKENDNGDYEKPWYRSNLRQVGTMLRNSVGSLRRNRHQEPQPGPSRMNNATDYNNGYDNEEDIYEVPIFKTPERKKMPKPILKDSTKSKSKNYQNNIQKAEQNAAAEKEKTYEKPWHKSALKAVEDLIHGNSSVASPTQEPLLNNETSRKGKVKKSSSTRRKEAPSKAELEGPYDIPHNNRPVYGTEDDGAIGIQSHEKDNFNSWKDEYDDDYERPWLVKKPNVEPKTCPTLPKKENVKKSIVQDDEEDDADALYEPPWGEKNILDVEAKMKKAQEEDSDENGTLTPKRKSAKEDDDSELYEPPWGQTNLLAVEAKLKDQQNNAQAAGYDYLPKTGYDYLPRTSGRPVVDPYPKGPTTAYDYLPPGTRKVPTSDTSNNDTKKEEIKEENPYEKPRVHNDLKSAENPKQDTSVIPNLPDHVRILNQRSATDSLKSLDGHPYEKPWCKNNQEVIEKLMKNRNSSLINENLAAANEKPPDIPQKAKDAKEEENIYEKPWAENSWKVVEDMMQKERKEKAEGTKALNKEPPLPPKNLNTGSKNGSLKKDNSDYEDANYEPPWCQNGVMEKLMQAKDMDSPEYPEPNVMEKDDDYDSGTVKSGASGGSLVLRHL